MIDLIEDNRDAIAELCRQYGVRKLAVLGSAVKGTFDSETSDLDFVADLGGYKPGIARRYIGFADALESFFGRSVDVVTIHRGTSNWFRDKLARTAVPLYDAGDQIDTA